MGKNAKMKIFGIIVFFFACLTHAMACGVSWGVSNMTAFDGINALGGSRYYRTHRVYRC